MSAGPLLTSKRLELWQPQIGDLADLFDLTLAEETRRFLGSFVPTEMDAFNRLLRNAGGWALYGYGIFNVRLQGGSKIIATCGVFRSHRGFGPEQGLDNVPEAGWIVHQDHWGQGIAREAMEAALAWFDAAHGQQRIACMIEEGHAASDKLARHLGFVEYGRQESEGAAPLLLYQRT
ncbi:MULTISPECIES: GNAT family N-acetyltransferase [unclassified Novosphingobium]|uniref:GNAT family N-acetyltransferase n=1 Tax=unclassified Novosphingobium TaxID=2644732 RepID=UPI000EDC4540|nr:MULTISPECIES: GNAT family N-acetyltransferase [unclassified Novosphingobium]HCF24261.1 N-acetyltransferase [Novosphingobium sp.]HQV02491.1 GNAT family N-acetyltransferase [Novosphingobium sp.]